MVVYAVLFMYEFIPLYKQKYWQDFWLNAILGLCSFTVALVLSFGGKIPSPAIPIQNVIESLFGK